MSDCLDPSLLAVKQSKVLGTLQRISAIMSLIGSLTIVVAIINDSQYRLKRARHRLLLGMSIIDALYSIALAFAALPIPYEDGCEHHSWGAMGNTATCTTQGFFVQWGFSVPLYNCSLSLYYVLVIIFSKSGKEISRKYEPLMHAVPIAYLLGTSIAGLLLDLYNNKGTFCWIEPYPMNCIHNSQNECTRGTNAYDYQWYFGGVPLMLSFPIIAVNMMWVYCYVKKQEIAMRRRNSNFANSYTSFNQKKETMYQALLFVLSFVLVWSWPVIVTLLEQFGVMVNIESFWLLVVLHTLMPSQGIWNFIVYVRPRFIEVKRLRPEASFCLVLKSAVFESGQSPRNGRRRRNSSTPTRSSSQTSAIPTRSSLQTLWTSNIWQRILSFRETSAPPRNDTSVVRDSSNQNPLPVEEVTTTEEIEVAVSVANELNNKTGKSGRRVSSRSSFTSYERKHRSPIQSSV